MDTGHNLGLHRVLAPQGALPQSAARLDNSPRAVGAEALIEVATLNITSGSFARMRKAHHDDPAAIAGEVLAVVAERGKYQDRVMGAGGILIGTIRELGPDYAGSLRVGDAVATLSSLSATPLFLETVTSVDLGVDQVHVRGQAVLFASSLYCLLPPDLPRALSLAVMDVAGAPAKVARSVTAGQTVCIMGGGKAGLLCMHEAMKRVGATGQVIVLEASAERCALIRSMGLAHHVLQVDAAGPVAVMEAFLEASGGRLADFTVNVVNAPLTEMAAILVTSDTGQVFFFNMATDFSRAALGAESAGKTCLLVMGNGYVPGHAELTFQILRESPGIRAFLSRLYVR